MVKKSQDQQISKNDPKGQDEIANAVRLLEKEQQRRIHECMQEIQLVLEKYGLELVVSTPVISLKPRT